MAYGRGRGVNGGYRRAVARAAQRYQRTAQALLTRVARERARRTGALARASARAQGAAADASWCSQHLAPWRAADAERGLV
ncbi:hypothetical protein GUJ93_ZPchr0006g45939 [Zizania palustris]|uniref:Uncharacterized protein n=1 Tax=Zizania palustris TaxID=103762 RepID=A0A8J5W213_ZIZPA|nr:hypothetical protein GUJ93_ZPchr0006g45939 [Zizania palustris]